MSVSGSWLVRKCKVSANRGFDSESREQKGVTLSGERSKNVVWHGGVVSRDDRADRLGHFGCTIWFTGYSGSGKSTVAVALEKQLHSISRHSYRLDGDNVRHGLNGDLGFSESDRGENLRRIGEVSVLMADAGLIVLCSFISPLRAQRDSVRALHESSGLPFYEVHVDVPLAVAEGRDPKGLYKKARSGEITDFTGIHQEYEAPEKPDLVVNTQAVTPEESARNVLDFLVSKKIFK